MRNSVEEENSFRQRHCTAGDRSKTFRMGRLGVASILFSLSFAFLFLGMSRVPNVYDEGLVLTAAMRVLAGQIPHKDFYAIYGPAEYYVFAGLFKIFGPSVLAERLLDLLFESATVTTAYLVLAHCCTRTLAIAGSLVTLAWLYALEVTAGYATIPITLLCLICTACLLPIFHSEISKRRTFGIGALAGIAALYRYDMGLALSGILVLAMAIGIYLRPTQQTALRRASVLLWPYLCGLAFITLPPALFFLSKSSVHPLLNDIIVLQSRNYHRGRNLPFPGVHWHSLDQLGVYLPVATVLITACMIARTRRQRGSSMIFESENTIQDARRQGLLITLSLIASVMYLKGTIRVNLVALYPSIIPSLLVIAILFQQRKSVSRWLKASIGLLTSIALLLTLLACVIETRILLTQHTVVGQLLKVTLFHHRNEPLVQKTWCKVDNPITKGFCFLPDDGRVQTIEYIVDHTRPDQPIYVGLSRHDKIFANDNVIYFGTQRLPATRWSHFDPGVQNSYNIQADMIHEFEADSPPYIVLDSEWNHMIEPNDSSKSSGVMLVDNYIHSHYRLVQTFDEMAIWERM